MMLLAAALIGCAVWLLMPSGRSPRHRALLGTGGALTPDASIDGAVTRWLAVMRARMGAARDRAARRDRALMSMTALAAEVSAGRSPGDALLAADPRGQVWPRARAALRVGGDVAAGLRADGADLPAVRSLAACWQVTEQSGAGLADAVDSLVRSMRADQQARDRLATELAGPRASAQLLAALPVAGLAVGLVSGADPIGWLLGSPLGLACLAAGVSLDVAGLVWTRRIATRIEQRI